MSKVFEISKCSLKCDDDFDKKIVHSGRILQEINTGFTQSIDMIKHKHSKDFILSGDKNFIPFKKVKRFKEYIKLN